MGQIFSNFSSPSSRLIELMMDFPWHQVRACSIASGFVVSMTSGVLTMRISFSRKALVAGSSSISVCWRFTSRMGAPALTCLRPISAAFSNSPAMISSRNFFEPVTFVRSPTMSGRLDSSQETYSMPLTWVTRAVTGRRGFPARAACAISRMYSGVVPQQPPTRFTQPCSMNRFSAAATILGVSLYFPSPSGSPALG
jgi:hypothetical protein